MLRGSKTACKHELPTDLWLVEIDKGQICQVIQNLIVNADQAMPDGGTIEMRGQNLSDTIVPPLLLSPGRRYVKITVSDTSNGIPALIIDKIFDPYFSTKQHGSGLGLAISHGIIGKHDGAITVTSTPGHGTTFTAYLPASNRTAQQEKKPMPTALKGKFTLMIMDDDEMVRTVAKTCSSFLVMR